jgi:predicted RNase H-like HicB family nuclease
VAGSALEKIERIQVKRGQRVTRSQMSFNVSIEKDELDGGYVAECIELPGCMSQGETEEEALENIVDAITAVLEAKMQRHLQASAFEFSRVEMEISSEGETPRRRAFEIPVT